MNRSPRRLAEFDRHLLQQVEALVEGNLSPDETRRLEQQVCDSPRARRLYVDFMHDALCLHEWASDLTDAAEPSELKSRAPIDLPLLADLFQHGAENAAVAPTPAASRARAASPVVARFPRVIAVLNRPLVFSLIVACVTCFSLLASLAQFPWQERPRRAARAPLAAARTEAKSVARWTGGVDCQWWAEDRPRLGQPLAIGKLLRLQQGLAEITLSSGARLVLEGPASLSLSGKNVTQLVSGRLAAYIPPAAQGFVVQTADAQVVDRGTEFSVAILDEGGTEVCVYQGRVDLLSDSGEQLALNAGEAARVRLVAQGPTAATVQKLASLPPPFKAVTYLDRQPAPPPPPLMIGDGLALWLSADQGVVRDAAGRVERWLDLTADQDGQAENAESPAVAARPDWVPGALAGRAAVRFDGVSQVLVTDELDLGNELSIVAVIVPRQPLGENGGQLFNGNGPPHLVLGVGPQGEVMAWGYTGNQADKLLTKLISPPYPHERPRVVAYTYGRAQGEATLSINGQLAGEADARAAVALRSAKYIGRHPSGRAAFRGDLAELLVYDRALDAAALHQVNQYLMTKYAIVPQAMREIR